MPLTRQQVFRRRRIAVFGGLLLTLAVGFYLPLTLLAPLATARGTVQEWSAPQTAAASPREPAYGASAIGAVGWDGVLASRGGNAPRTIASITKVITALVVLDKKPIAPGTAGASIRFTEADVGIYNSYLARNGEVRPVPVGESLTQKQVLQVALIASANNYARTLVEWAFGSETAFLKAAAGWLTKHGMDDTRLGDSTGMDPRNRSTPSDLLKLGALALDDPLVAKIVSTTQVTVPFLGPVTNTNDLLGVDGIRGIKTGTLDEAGSCLLFTSTITVGGQKVTLLGVVLGGPDHATVNRGVKALLASVAAGFQEVPLATRGQVFARYTTPWGDEARAVASKDAAMVVWSDTPVTAVIEAAPVRLADAGAAAGTVIFTAGPTVLRVPLRLDAQIDDPGAWWRLTHPFALK